MTTRPEDGWQTVWIRDRGRTRDLLPGDAGGKLASPGIRALSIGKWLNNRELTILHRCGAGCVAIHRLNADTGELIPLWKGAVDGLVHWSPTSDLAV